MGNSDSARTKSDNSALFISCRSRHYTVTTYVPLTPISKITITIQALKILFSEFLVFLIVTHKDTK